MAAFDLDDVSLDERESGTSHTVTRTLDKRAELAEGEPPKTDRTAQEDVPQLIIETGAQFTDSLIDIQEGDNTHSLMSALNESPDRDPFATVSIDAHPPANQTMTLPARYEQQGVSKTGANNP